MAVLTVAGPAGEIIFLDESDVIHTSRWRSDIADLGDYSEDQLRAWAKMAAEILRKPQVKAAVRKLCAVLEVCHQLSGDEAEFIIGHLREL